MSASATVDRTISIGDHLVPDSHFVRFYKIGFHLEDVALQQTR